MHTRVHVDETTQEIIESPIRKRGLSIKESNGDYVVSTPKALIETVA